jgi:hypothetical protein
MKASPVDGTKRQRSITRHWFALDVGARIWLSAANQPSSRAIMHFLSHKLEAERLAASLAFMRCMTETW